MGIMAMTAMSVVATITGLILHHRSGETHTMSKFVSTFTLPVLKYYTGNTLPKVHKNAVGCQHLVLAYIFMPLDNCIVSDCYDCVCYSDSIV